MNTFVKNNHTHIELDPTAKWEIIVDHETGSISIACVHGEGNNADRCILCLGYMECIELPHPEMLTQGLDIIRSGGFIMGETSLN